MQYLQSERYGMETGFELVKWELNDQDILFLDLIDKGYTIN